MGRLENHVILFTERGHVFLRMQGVLKNRIFMLWIEPLGRKVWAKINVLSKRNDRRIRSLNFWVDHVGGLTKNNLREENINKLNHLSKLISICLVKFRPKKCWTQYFGEFPEVPSMDHPLPSFQKPTEVSIYHQPDSCLQICEVNFLERGLSRSAWRRTRGIFWKISRAKHWWAFGKMYGNGFKYGVIFGGVDLSYHKS